MKKDLEISATTFKATCLEVLRSLERRTYARVIVTRRGKPIAELTAPRTATPKLWGSLRGSIDVAPGVDLTKPVLAESLDAEQGIFSR
jgi:antitoxin (DNA-binding transcriptional repressor) of toxin-antitoxin stability system